MSVPTRKELEDQMTALQSQLDAAGDEDEYEVWIKNDKGAETKIPGSRAGSWLKENFGISLTDEAPAGDGGDGGQGDGGQGQGDPKPAGGGYFNKRKAS